MEKHAVAAANEVVPGRGLVRTVGGIEIGLFAVAGGFRAYRNLCPHAGAPICRGEVTRLTVPPARPGVRFEANGEVLRCPWHAWEFYLESGEHVSDPDTRLESFPVEVVDGQLVVSL
jgi:nitrite reductase (NADH) small subunit